MGWLGDFEVGPSLFPVHEPGATAARLSLEPRSETPGNLGLPALNL